MPPSTSLPGSAPVPSAADLPERPRVGVDREPVVRAGDAVQFGVAAARAVVLDGLTPPLVRMVTGLDGTRRVDEVVADAVAAGAGPGTAHAVLRHLHHAGVLEAAPPPRAGVVVHGGGRVAVALACLLATSPACRVVVSADGRVGADDLGTGLTGADLGRPRLAAMTDAVDRAAGTAARPAVPADLVVLAGAAALDPALLGAVTGPHLPVAVRGGVGVVGPLVLPGRTPCLRCAELARAEEDPAWPAIAAQLVHHTPAVAPTLATATAALGADQVLAALRPGPPGPPVLGATLEIDPLGVALRRHPVAWHRHCDCRGAAHATPAAA